MFINTSQWFTLGFTLARVISGIIFIWFGLEIFSDEQMSGYTQWLTDIKFPLPAFMAYLGKVAEFLGGLSLVFGLFTRWFCIPAMFTMFVITFIMGESDIRSSSFMLLLLGLVFLSAGAGPWSLDHYKLNKGKNKNSGTPTRILIFILISLNISYAQNQSDWITKPFNQWPQIALVNDFRFKDGSGYEDTSLSYAATAFLIKQGVDTYAITVKHVLFVAWKKLENKVAISDKIDPWLMYPKNEKNKSFKVGSLINEDPNEKIQDGYENGVLQRDWLVFKTQNIPNGFYPLTIRKSEPAIHEKVYMVGNPYRFDQTLQLKGEIVKKEGDLLLVEFDISEGAYLGGASGSPIIDQHGELVGIFSSAKMDSKTGKKLSIVNSTSYLNKVLNGTKPLNQNLYPVSKIVDSLVHHVSVRSALRELNRLMKDPRAYYTVNLSWPDINAFDSTGDQLMEKGKSKEAIQYYTGLLKLYPDLHFYILSLAKAYQAEGNIKQAKQVLSDALKTANPFTKPQFEKKLQELEK